MARRSWTLTDVEGDGYVDEIKLGPADVGGDITAPYSVLKRRLHGGLQDGLDAIEVDNGRCRFIVLPDRGMGVWRAWVDDVELGWNSPARGPVHPRYVPVGDPSGIGWLWGFDEWLCRCGLESNGAPEFGPDGRVLQPLHGRIANLPARMVEVAIDTDSGEIVVRGVVAESRIFGVKLQLTSTIRTRFGEAGMRFTDEVTNLSAEPGEFELIYHINFGHPFLTPGAKIAAPVAELAPRDADAALDIGAWDVYAAEQPGQSERVHFLKLLGDADGRTLAVLESASGSRGVSLHYNCRQMPCFTLWKCHQGTRDAYVTGFEPGVNYPNIRSYEAAQGRVARLAPGETRRFDLGVEVHANADSLAAAKRAVVDLQAAATPVIHSRPQPGWSPAGE